MRVLSIILLLLLLGLQLMLWFGDGGIPRVKQLERDVAEQQAENERLQARNAELIAEVEDLSSGNAATEERARTELGLIKDDESFYQLVVPPANEPDSDPDTP